MREEKLIVLLEADPEKGIAALQECYGPRVRWMVSRILGADRKEDIEECVSDVWVKVWQESKGYCRERGSLISWIYGIARHTAIDRFRRLAGKESLPFADFCGQEELGVNPDFADQAARRENARILREAVHGMKQPDRNIFLLRYFYFLSVKEIALKLELTEKQVENRLRRGRERLKKELTERGVILE